MVLMGDMTAPHRGVLSQGKRDKSSKSIEQLLSELRKDQKRIERLSSHLYEKRVQYETTGQD